MDLLRKRGYCIGIPQTGETPNDFLVENMNNMLKKLGHISCEELYFQEAKHSVERAVLMYNEACPHQDRGQTSM